MSREERWIIDVAFALVCNDDHCKTPVDRHVSLE